MALLGSDTPVVLIASTRAERARLWATAAEVRALGAPVIALAERGDPQASVAADHGLELPEAPEPLAAVLALVPLQILAYQLGVLRGCDVDQPRNLAKSVIVE